MGGRGAKFSIQRSNSKWSKNGVGEKVSETLKEALGTKGKAFSIGDAVVETNPNYSGDYREFSENCQRCIIAYELRRRGYDVTALPTYKDDDLNRIAYIHDGIFEGRWKGAFRNAKTENVGNSKKTKSDTPAAEKEVISNIEKKMKEYGEGSRAVVQILYRGGGGHVFNVEYNHGKVQYIEAQSGKIKDIKKTMASVDSRSVNLVRTDNLKLSDRAKNFVKKKKR